VEKAVKDKLSALTNPIARYHLKTFNLKFGQNSSMHDDISRHFHVFESGRYPRLIGKKIGKIVPARNDNLF
jgi:hypothetical protein